VSLVLSFVAGVIVVGASPASDGAVSTDAVSAFFFFFLRFRGGRFFFSGSAGGTSSRAHLLEATSESLSPSSSASLFQ